MIQQNRIELLISSEPSDNLEVNLRFLGAFLGISWSLRIEVKSFRLIIPMYAEAYIHEYHLEVAYANIFAWACISYIKKIDKFEEYNIFKNIFKNTIYLKNIDE